MVTTIRGSTRICGIFGFPVEHSFSPVMHNAAFSFLNLDYVYVPFCVAPERLLEAVRAVRALNLTGVNVTVPHKEKVIPFLDEVAPAAKLTGAVNTIVNKDGRLYGYNTDGMGFLRSLKEETGFVPEGKAILILGAGGAARAVAVELALAGVKEIIIVNRTVERAKELAKLLNENTQTKAKVILWSEEELTGAAGRAHLIVQTTPVGMYPNERSCPSFPFKSICSKHVVCDLIYNPPLTKFLKEARNAGARVINGLCMLLYQGVQAFKLWTGLDAPVEVMKKVLLEQIKFTEAQSNRGT